MNPTFILRSNLAKFRAQLVNFPQTLRLLRAAAARDLAIWAATLVAQGLLPAAVVLLSKGFVDALGDVLRSPKASPSAIEGLALIAGAIGVSLLAIEALRVCSSWLRVKVAGAVEDHVSDVIHHKSTQVDIAFYDTPEYHDHLHRARNEASYRPVALLENAGSLLQNGITLFAMAAILLPYGVLMSAALVFSTLPALWVVVGHAVREHEWRNRVSADERRGNYLSWMMTGAHAAAEMRLFGIGERFREGYNSLKTRLRGERLRVVAQQGWADFFASLIAFTVAAACLASMGWRAATGAATLGDLVLFYQAFMQGQRLMRTLLANVGQVYYNSLFLGNLFEFLNLKPNVEEPLVIASLPSVATGTDGLSLAFENVSFDYPGTARRALDGLNLSVPPGQIAAIVGANGAGKSTLVKLLCRFYDPQSGRVLVGGVDARNVSLEKLRERVTVLFQDPVRYQATVAENILPRGVANASDTAQAQHAAVAAGADAFINVLPSQFETPLGRWFGDGVELSGGQWQRVALARAFARDASVVILDEPTSAMDSWAETEWLNRFRDVMKGRTALIITHRFTTAMQADVIHVMEGGRIIESGSHSELLRMGGAYSSSWNAQMQAERSVA
jgi:ATP-binding cassette subfamily B protein